MTLTVLTLVSCILALVPALVFWRNLRLYVPPPPYNPQRLETSISVLIPARDEERSIRAAVEAALASEGTTLEVIVLDDHSQDRTAMIVTELAKRDARVRLVSAPPLPPGWCGKQHACAVLAREARLSLLVFVDADVRLAPDGLARMAAFLDRSKAELVSGFPRQETGTTLERLVIPLIHFLLLGFLPFRRMRNSAHPAYGAGCGQFFMVRRESYDRVGGHSAIRSSLHDGIMLPRAFRRAGFMTDLCDATEIATCRMYRSAEEVWRGLAKNAGEGLATPTMILPITLLLLGGQVLPLLLLIGALSASSPLTLSLAAFGTAAAYYPRLVGVWRFRQPLSGAIFHPFGVAVLLAIQWWAFARARLGRPAIWKGRTYAAQS